MKSAPESSADRKSAPIKSVEHNFASTNRALRKRLGKAKHADVSAFIERYADQPVGHRMRRAWLYQLAKQGKWTAFLSTYEGDQPTRLQCYRLKARMKTRPSSARGATTVRATTTAWVVRRCNRARRSTRYARRC